MSRPELPVGWVRATGADVFEFVTSGSRGWAQYYSEQGAAYIRMGNLDHGTITLDLGDIQRVQPPVGAEGERTRLRPDDILISITAELGMVGLVPATLEEAYINQHIALARPKPGNDPEFIAWHLASEADGKRQLQEMRRGATKAGLGLEDIRRVEIPLPPLNEQRRIVAKIEELTDRSRRAREALDAVPALLDRFRQSVLAAAFRGELTRQFRQAGNDHESIEATISRVRLPSPRRSGEEPASIPGLFALRVGNAGTPAPEGWRWVRLTDVARLESGHTPSRSHPEYWDGEIPWIGIKDAGGHHGGRILNTIQSVTQDGIDNSAARVLPAETVCLSRTASVGYVCIMGRPMATSQDFVNWVCSEAVNPQFLMYALQAEGEHIRRFGKGSTHTTIYFPEVLAFQICLPSVAEQEEVVRAIEARLDSLASIEKLFEGLHHRFSPLDQAILAKAFRGELVPQDPNDEPASVLLECIRGERAEAVVPKAKRGRKPSELAGRT